MMVTEPGIPGAKSNDEAAELPCRVFTHEDTTTRQFTVSCRTHGCTVLVPTFMQATILRDFTCDKGAGWAFLVRYAHEDLPSLLDATRLKSRLRSDIEQAHFSGFPDVAVVRRWVDDDTLLPVVLRHVPGTGKPVPDAYTSVVSRVLDYEVIDVDDTVYMRVTVPIHADV